MKKTFISDAKKFNKELGEYIFALINNEYITKPENLNELLYSFFLGRLISIEDVNLILENSTPALKAVLTDYISYFKNEVKIDITENILKNFNEENTKKTKEQLCSNGINITEEVIDKVINEILLIRKHSLSICVNDYELSNEMNDVSLVVSKLYNDLLNDNFSSVLNNKEYESNFISIFVDLTNSYLYFDDEEIKELNEKLKLSLDKLKKSKEYEYSINEILGYFEPLTKDKLNNLIRINANDLIFYDAFLELLFSKIDYSLLLNKEENIKDVIIYLTKIYAILTNKYIEEKTLNSKTKEFHYKLLLINSKNHLDLLDYYDFSSFISEFFKEVTFQDLIFSFYDFFDIFVNKYEIAIDEKLSDILKYLITLYNSACNFYLSRDGINMYDLDGKTIESILLKYLDLNFISETLSIQSDKLGLSEIKKENKNVHKKYKMLTDELDQKLKMFNKIKKVNCIIESNLYLFYDYYTSLNLIIKSRSKLNRIKEFKIVRSEKKYVNNFIKQLALSLDIEYDFLNNKFGEGNIENETVLNIKVEDYHKFKKMNDELLKLKLSNIIDYKYNVLN